MEMLREVLKECMISYNDIYSTKRREKSDVNLNDIEVAFGRIIVCFEHTFHFDTLKIKVKFIGFQSLDSAKMLADTIAKMSCVVDSPHLHVSTDNVPISLDAIFTKCKMYDMAKLLLYFTRFPRLESHEENIL